MKMQNKTNLVYDHQNFQYLNMVEQQDILKLIEYMNHQENGIQNYSVAYL